MNALLFALPGTPVIYYGDELRMGDNFYLGDRNGVRTPMQWSADRNAGFSRANPQRLYLPIIIDPEYHYEAVNVEAQQNNPHSLLWWMKRLIALRKRFKAFGRGTLEFLHPDNHKVLAFVRRYQDECVLVLANLSRFVQGVELDLSPYKGHAGRNLRTHRISMRRLIVTMGPRVLLVCPRTPASPGNSADASGGAAAYAADQRCAGKSLYGRGQGGAGGHFAHLPQRASLVWWQGEKDEIGAAAGSHPSAFEPSEAYITLLQVDYAEGDADIYVLPLTAAFGEVAARMREGFPIPCWPICKEGEGWTPARDRDSLRCPLRKASVRCYWTSSCGTAACTATTVTFSPSQHTFCVTLQGPGSARSIRLL